MSIGRIRHTNDWKRLPLTGDRPAVSVVVVHFEQHAELGRNLACIDACVGVDIVDVTVVDDGSLRPPSLPDCVCGVTPVLVRQRDEGCRAAAARNLGADQGSGDVVVFLDADTAPAPDALALLSRLPATQPWSIAVGARHHYDFGSVSPKQLRRWVAAEPPVERRLGDPAWLADLYHRTDDLASGDERSWQGVISANLATSRQLLDHLGGFDATMVGYGGEDWEFAYRAWCAGAYLGHVADAHFFHDGPDWGARGEAPKNGERRALVARIPGPSDPVIGTFAQILVELDTQGWSPDQTLHACAALLGAHPMNLFVALSDPDGVPVGSDPRLRAGPFGEDQISRSLVRVKLTEPVETGPQGLAGVLEPLLRAEWGEIELVDDVGRTVGSATSTRLMARHRHLGTAIEKRRVNLADIGARLAGSVDLARSFVR